MLIFFSVLLVVVVLVFLPSLYSLLKYTTWGRGEQDARTLSIVSLFLCCVSVVLAYIIYHMMGV